MVDVDIASPEEVERPVSGKQVKDDVSQEWTLSQRKRLGDGHRANHYCGHKYPSTWRNDSVTPVINSYAEKFRAMSITY